MTRLKAATDDIARIPGRGIYTEPARRERLEWTRQQTGAALGALDITASARGRAPRTSRTSIGAVEVPVGLAGPLLFRRCGTPRTHLRAARDQPKARWWRRRPRRHRDLALGRRHTRVPGSA